MGKLLFKEGWNEKMSIESESVEEVFLIIFYLYS